MKNYVVILIAMMIVQFCVPARAAFFIKAVPDSVVRTRVVPVKPDEEKESGWAGITALACGAASIVVGVVGFPLIFFLPAIIFGIVGLGKNKKHHALAVMGIVLGVIGFLLLLLTA